MATLSANGTKRCFKAAPFLVFESMCAVDEVLDGGGVPLIAGERADEAGLVIGDHEAELGRLRRLRAPAHH